MKKDKKEKRIELYKKHRPKTIDQIYGQPNAVKQMENWIEKDKCPQAILFTGPSGCGKTTAARILAKSVGCAPGDIHEMNAANCRGIDEIRELDDHSRRKPLGGSIHVWIVDECHQLTKQAQDSFLKPLEDTPRQAYFFLCSSEPLKLKKAIRTRCSKINFGLLSDKSMRKLLESVVVKETDAKRFSKSVDVYEKIIEFAGGSAREALVMLDQVIDLDDDEARISMLESSRTESQAELICKALLEKNPSFHKVAKIIKDIEDEAETVRHRILAYMNVVVLSCSPASGRANTAISFFRDNFYDCGMSGLTNACYEFCHSKG